MAPVPSDNSDRGHALVERLRDSGYRLTPQRLALVHLLAEDDTHPSADQVYSRLRVAYPTMSLATVYNTLEVLVGLGEALALDFSDGCVHYDVKRPAAHPHLICRGCGKVEDLDLAGLATLTDQARQRSDFQALRLRLYFDGICPACAGSSEKTLCAERTSERSEAPDA